MQLDAKTVHAPEFGQLWLNTAVPLSLRALRGHLKEWDSRYRGKGLTIVGVHTPEFYFASVTELVQIAVRDFGIHYPVVLDNDYQIWQAFANRYWPAKYLIDPEGYMRYFSPGEGNYGETETAIQALLRERDPDVQLPPVMQPLRALDQPGVLQVCRRPTPELYLGSKRSDEQRNAELLRLRGEWVEREDSLAAKPNPSVSMELRYEAAEVNVVLASSAECPVARLEILDNGKPVPAPARGTDVVQAKDGTTWVEISRPRMYSLLRRDSFAEGVLEIRTASPGLEFFAFTFVTSCV
jgi:hypothetical protein